MNRYPIIATIAAGLMLSAGCLPAQAQHWVPAGGKTCLQACAGTNTTPLVAGIYTNNNPFYVCRGNADNAGLRPGYNLLPTWGAACWVGSSNKEQGITPYDCLCIP